MRALETESMSSSRFAPMFAACRAQGRAALLAYVMGGDPDPRASLAFARACVDGGADAVELGVPFSDPIADGPVIQRAAERALAAGTTLPRVLGVAAALRAASDVPIALMTYANPVLSLGEARFAERCARAGVDAAIVPDLPANEAGELGRALGERRVGLVTFLSPVTRPERAELSARRATAFVYFVSVTGVTGARRALPPELPDQLASAKRLSPVPVVVGFGISAPRQARALGAVADGVVVGSAIVRLAAAPGPVRRRAARIARFVSSLRNALERSSR